MQLQDTYFANLNAISHVGGLFSVESGYVWKLSESHFSQNKFYYILEGGCTIRIQGKQYEGIPGRCFFIPAGIPHSYSNDITRPFSKYWMHFDLLPRDVNLFTALNLPYYIDVEKGSTLHNLFEEYSLLAGSNAFSDKLRVKALLLSMLAEYIRLATTAEIWVANTENKRGQQLLCYIQEHMHQNLSNAVMADFLHMEVRSFIRFFKKLTGYTPAKYVTLRRMELAKTLLEESELPILDIMYRVGMQDISHFSKLFKQHYSLSPRNYREMLNRAW